MSGNSLKTTQGISGKYRDEVRELFENPYSTVIFLTVL
jgi:hypothetical protein